jgi:hypothetical protein
VRVVCCSVVWAWVVCCSVVWGGIVVWGSAPQDRPWGGAPPRLQLSWCGAPPRRIIRRMGLRPVCPIFVGWGSAPSVPVVTHPLSAIECSDFLVRLGEVPIANNRVRQGKTERHKAQKAWQAPTIPGVLRRSASRRTAVLGSRIGRMGL